MIWPWRRPAGPPWAFTDAIVASVRDPAARNLLDQARGMIRELQARVQALENRQEEVTARLADVQYKEGSTFLAGDVAAKAAAARWRDATDTDR